MASNVLVTPHENPVFSVVHMELEEDEAKSCDENESFEVVSVTNEFYSISLKKIISGEIIHGRTKYDCSNGTMLFAAPSQTMIFKGLVFSSEAYHIAFHKDFLIGSRLFEQISKFSFFNYHVNEALHLSPKEEQQVKAICRNIKIEYHNNQDEFSKEINQDLFSRFSNILDAYCSENKLEEKGIPTVEWLANQLGVSHRYMSDTIKTETGKTATDQINLFLVEQAKNLLLNPNQSISETAYKLGFEYPQYFSRLFKKKVGVSPKHFIEKQQLN